MPESNKDITVKQKFYFVKRTVIEGVKLNPNGAPQLCARIEKEHQYNDVSVSFAEMVAELCTLALDGTGIRYILQKDLNILLRAGELANGPTDVAWLKQQVTHDVFDVYVVADCKVLDEASGQIVTRPKCFGCVQCKTSVRDRVSRDRVPSLEAMDAQFWSIAFVLDGTALGIPKYTNMVNGNVDSEFKCNSWHGVYVISQEECNDRIYGVDVDFNIVREHTLRVFTMWKDDRQGYSRAWRADGHK